nr:hypothetical protein [Chlamydiota bacterium]
MSLAVHASPIQEYLDQEEYEKAFDRVEAFFLQQPEDAKVFAEICELLESLFPHLSKENQEKLLEKVCKEISRFPGLKKEQQRMLELYGELFLEKVPDLENLVGATRCLSISLALGGDLSLHKSLSRPFLYKALEGFEVQLQQAAGKGEVGRFQQLLEAIPIWHQKFSQSSLDIQKFYEKARLVYRGLNEKNKVQFSSFLEVIEKGETLVIPLESPKFLTQGYHKRLEKVRSCFQEQGKVRELQQKRAAKMQEFFHELLDDAIFILGEPPCQYDIRAMGSLAREEVCPYSDLEYFILIEKEEGRRYFQKLAQIFDLQILSLGETDPKHQELFNFGQKFGLEIDHQANPAFNDSLIGRAEGLLALPEEPNEDDLKAYKSKLRSVSLHGNHTFETPKIDLTEYAQKLLEMRRVDFEKLQILQGEVCAIKRDFVEPLFHFLGDLGLLLGLEECNTLDLIKQLPFFTDLSKRLLEESVSDLYHLRIRLHAESEGIQEEASLIPSLQLPVLKEQEKEALHKTHQLVLLPLYQADLEEKEIDLLKLAMQQPTEEKVRSTARFLQHASIEIHQEYYQMLSSPGHVELQALYQAPQEIQKVLREIPNRAGYRQSRKTEDQELRRRLSLITTENAN